MVVIGAGAAGVSAAIECFDIQLDVVVLEAASSVGGQIDQIPHAVRNVAPAPDGNDALVDALASHASILGDRLQLDRPVTRLDLDDGLVVAGTHRYRARSVLVATGSRRRELEKMPEGSFGGDVTYLVEPHLARFAGRPMAVIGGGDSAVLDALALAEAGSSVTLLHRSPRLTRQTGPRRTRPVGGVASPRWRGGRPTGSSVPTGLTGSRYHTGHRRASAARRRGHRPQARTRAVRRAGARPTGPRRPRWDRGRRRRSTLRIRGHSPPATWSRAPTSESPPPSARAPSPPAPSSVISSPLRERPRPPHGGRDPRRVWRTQRRGQAGRDRPKNRPRSWS